MGIPFGRYELLKRIAAGGMGEVFLARQAGMQGFEKLLVVKVLLPHLLEDEEFVAMFLDEARIAAHLNHPNIAQIFDLGEVEGAFFIAMEYVHGEDVVRLWKASRAARKPVPLALAVRIAADASAGLDYAHKAVDGSQRPLLIVHRDVSPQNVLVTFEGGVKVIDFGVAKAADRSSHTATGTLKGKYSYMSPEQADGRSVDRRSDVFALGVVLYEMATSLRLFKRDTEVNTLKAVTECRVPPPSERNAEIDPALEAVILKALTRDPDERFPDAGALRLSLEDWLVQSRRPGSSAHLATYMQDLYAARLSSERADGRPFTEFEGTPSAVFRRGPSRPSSPRTRGPPEERPPAGRFGSSASRPSPSPPPSPSPEHRGRRALLALGAAAALGLGAAAAIFWNRATHPSPGSPAPAPAWALRSRPAGARVRLDGVELGRTPLEVPTLPAPGVVLELVLDGYKPFRQSITPRTGAPLDVELEALPAPAPAAPAQITVEVRSAPPGAQVFLEGREIGQTPFTYRCPRGPKSLSLTFRRPGYEPRVEIVDGEAGGTLDAHLERARPAANAAPPPEPALQIKTGR